MVAVPVTPTMPPVLAGLLLPVALILALNLRLTRSRGIRGALFCACALRNRQNGARGQCQRRSQDARFPGLHFQSSGVQQFNAA